MLSSRSEKQYFVIDFDSALVKVESLEELAKIALRGKKMVVKKIARITREGMEGKIPFEQSLEQRLKLLSANRGHLRQLIKQLRQSVTLSVKRNREFFRQKAGQIYIISGGFKEFIVPVVKRLGISESHVLANEFKFDRASKIVGFVNHGNKQEQLKKLNLKGEIVVIGDGYTDYEMKANGAAKRFYAWTENVFRRQVVKLADYVLPNLDEFLYEQHLPRAYSYPKHRIRVKLWKRAGKKIKEVFAQEGYKIEPTSRRLALVSGGKQLLAVALWGAKYNLKKATKTGVAVFAKAEQAVKFVNTGATRGSLNLPNLSLPRQIKVHRLIHLHWNQPGVLAAINTILARGKINIEGQYLRTNKEVGYVITDVNKQYKPEALKKLKRLKETIRLRLLY